MGIFDSIAAAIFGHQVGQAPARAPAHSAGASLGASVGAAAPAAAKVATGAVDVEAVLTERAALKKEHLNWQHSIVDLMKVVDLDSSLAARKELAQELGYKGERDGSAEMNIWLHKQVMQKLAANGGKVPADLTS